MGLAEAVRLIADEVFGSGSAAHEAKRAAVEEHLADGPPSAEASAAPAPESAVVESFEPQESLPAVVESPADTADATASPES